MKRKLPFLAALALSVCSALPAFATVYTVNVSSNQFSPASVTMNTGDTVKWVWVNGSHTTTSSSIPTGATPWNSPITSSVTTYSYVPSVAGTYNYVCTPHASMGMVGTLIVNCLPPTAPAVTASGNGNACQGSSVSLNTSVSGVTYQWKLNGNNIAGATNATYSAASGGSYTLTVTNGCGSATSAPVTVTINPNPVAAFSFTKNNMTYNFTNTTSGTTTAWEWNFGDGGTSTQQNPTHTYTTAGTKQVKLKVTSNNTCQDDTTISLVVTSVGTVAGLESFSMSPNPATDMVKLHIGRITAEVSLLDMTGRLVKSLQPASQTGDDQYFSVRDIPAGLYLLQVKAKEGVRQEKLLIAH
jgi:plastocyanin